MSRVGTLCVRPPALLLTTGAHHRLVGITTLERLDSTLYERAQAEGKKRGGGGGSSSVAESAEDGSKGGKAEKAETLYYKVMVRDNGCGMKHEQVSGSRLTKMKR